MNESPDDFARIMHIRDAITEIENYTQGFTLHTFIDDSKTRFATIKQLEIIGEAANAVSEKLKEEYHEVEWNKIIGLRHILVHEYFGIDTNILWRIVEHDIPNLKLQVGQISLQP